MHFEFALLIPIFALSIGMVAVIGKVIVKPLLQHRMRKLELEAQIIAGRAAQYAANAGRIEERVRVLERIVTDRGIDIADEIERLRDAPLN